MAPWLHTVAVLLMLFLWAAYSAMRTRTGVVSDQPRWLRYGSQIMMSWMMTGAVVAGLYQRRRFFRSVLGRFVWSDLRIGVLVFLGGTVLLAVVGIALRPLHMTHQREVVVALGPHTVLELAIWMVVSATAGICEELIFRGYLLRQVAAWTGSNAVAVLGTGAVFGAMHIYEGTASAVQIAVLGALLGLVAVRTGSLRQVMIAHFLQDAVAGVALFAAGSRLVH